MDSLHSNVVETIEKSRILIRQSREFICLSMIMREELLRAEDAAWRTRQEARKTIAYNKGIDGFLPNAK